MKSIKCDSCGQFIGYANKNDVHFIPDTEYTIEQTIFRCPKCIEKYGKIEKTLYEKKEENKFKFCLR